MSFPSLHALDHGAALKKKKKNYSAARVLRGGSQDLLVTVCRLFQLRHAEDLVP